MIRANQLAPDRVCVLVIDIQEKLLPLILHHDRAVQSCTKLLNGVSVFSVPVVVTEQYPKGLGKTVSPIGDICRAGDSRVIEKPTFSAWAEPAVREVLLALDRPQIIVVGIEAHVCVQQSVLDLVSRDYDVFVCADAVGSRGRFDYERALERMRQEGAWVTTVESVLFELCHRCDTPEFKRMLEVIKAHPPAE